MLVPTPIIPGERSCLYTRGVIEETETQEEIAAMFSKNHKVETELQWIRKTYKALSNCVSAMIVEK